MKFQQKALLIGGIAGALIGVAAAYLWIRSNEERIAAVEAGEANAVTKIAPGEALGIGLTTLGLVRQIVGMGQG